MPTNWFPGLNDDEATRGDHLNRVFDMIEAAHRGKWDEVRALFESSPDQLEDMGVAIAYLLSNAHFEGEVEGKQKGTDRTPVPDVVHRWRALAFEALIARTGRVDGD